MSLTMFNQGCEETQVFGAHIMNALFLFFLLHRLKNCSGQLFCLFATLSIAQKRMSSKAVKLLLLLSGCLP